MTPTTIVHIPHASTEIPEDVRASIVLDDGELDHELRLLTDWHTEELFALPPASAATVTFEVSRFVVDPERLLDDSAEPMAAKGMGVVYTNATDGRPLRSEVTKQQRADLVKRYYEPHHQALEAAVQAALDEHGHCLIIDAHSFPSRPLACDLEQTGQRPDICIGSDDAHTPDWLVSAAVEQFSRRGMTVEVNRPYSGTMVPQRWYHKDGNVHSVMIEVNRRLYMDQTTGRKLPGFAAMCDTVQAAVADLASTHASRMAANGVPDPA